MFYVKCLTVILGLRVNIHGILDIEAVVGSKHQTDVRDEVGDVVIHNLAIYT